MKDFAATLEHLIMRDVMYILGGASVLLSAAYLSDTACNTSYLCEGLVLSGFHIL